MDFGIDRSTALSLLKLQWEAGVDELLEPRPEDWFSLTPEPQTVSHRLSPPPPSFHSTPVPSSQTEKTDTKNMVSIEGSDSNHVAFSAKNIRELEILLEKFDGCSLKRTATRTVFADGNPDSRIMLIGEAPGAEEDRLGKPFVGPAGQLLDQMLHAIGLTRHDVYITNVCYWRPPGNRKPSDAEWAACRPFTMKHIELANPKAILLLGGSAAQQVMNVTDGITRIRGQWRELRLKGGKLVPSLATFHPAYLLRQPAAKKESWQDLLSFRKKII